MEHKEQFSLQRLVQNNKDSTQKKKQKTPLYTLLELRFFYVFQINKNTYLNLFRGPPNTNICQVWVHYAQWLQRRSLKCEMFTTMITTTDNN